MPIVVQAGAPGTGGSGNNVQFIGELVQIAGVASAVAGVVLSLHHWPAAVCLVGGGVAFYIGKKLRGQ